MNGKEIAKLIRKSNDVIIEKFEDRSYNVTDSYVMVNLMKLNLASSLLNTTATSQLQIYPLILKEKYPQLGLMYLQKIS